MKPEELVGVYRFDIDGSAFYKYLTGHDPGDDLPPDVTPMAQADLVVCLRGEFDPRAEYMPVSYTHLTLPTICSV